MSSIIKEGFSFLGLSEVTIVVSLNLSATLPIKNLLLLSLSPPQPKTVIIDCVGFLKDFMVSNAFSHTISGGYMYLRMTKLVT